MKSALFPGNAIPVLALAFASTVNLSKKLIYNASESAPIGFYWVDREPVSRGDYAYVRVSGRVRDLVIERGYLPPDVPIIKRVVGLNGDRICRDGTQISLNGTVVETVKEQDGLGRKMPEWHGCHILAERTVFLLQDHPRSFDGRDFGPVDRRLVVGVACAMAERRGNLIQRQKGDGALEGSDAAECSRKWQRLWARCQEGDCSPPWRRGNGVAEAPQVADQRRSSLGILCRN